MRVHLVFHGVFAYVLTPNGIDVMAPYFAPHEFLFGCWEKFVALPKGASQVSNLIGVERGKAPNPDFNPNLLPTVFGFTESSPTNLYCVVHLPLYPLRVDHFRLYTKDLNGTIIERFPFTGTHGDKLDPDALSGPAVFTYEADEANLPQLVFREREVAFERVTDTASDGSGEQALNLHFFSGGEKELPPRGSDERPLQAAIHMQEAWARLTGLVAGLDIRLKQVGPFVIGKGAKVPVDDVLPGLPGIQLATLEELAEIKHYPEGLIAKQFRAGTVGGHDCDCEPIQICVDNRWRG